MSKNNKKIDDDMVKKAIFALLSIVIWILIWFYTAVRVDSPLFLPGPKEVWTTLTTLIFEEDFKAEVFFSLTNITKGFALAVSFGIILAWLANTCSFLRTFISFPINVIKSVPVASFTILALLWVDSKNLSVLVSFLMGLPIIFTNVLKGIDETDSSLLEMSRVFRMRFDRKVRLIYIPAVIPYFISSCSVAAGMCWKSGIAAEVIGITKNSIGNALYQSKLYLEIPRLFAYTIVIIFISIIFEKVVIFLLSLLSSLISSTKPAKIRLRRKS